MAFSVIIPIYNAIDFLESSLHNLSEIFREDVRFIFVDDGSEDGSVALLERFCAKNPSCSLIKRRHAGVSAARNAGLRAAKGDYVLFLDIDDCYRQEIFVVLREKLEKSNADILVFGAYVFNYDEAHTLQDIVPRDIVYEKFSPEVLFEEKGSFPYVWNCAYRRKFLQEKELFFRQELFVGEDLVFQFCAFPKAKRIQFISNKLYCYQYLKYNSVMRTYDVNASLRFEQHLRIVCAVLREWKASGDYTAMEPHFLVWMHGFLCGGLIALPRNCYKQGAADLRAMLKEYGITVRKIPVSVKKKVAFFCLLHPCAGRPFRGIKKIVRKS